ncbi:MAG: hypothetical protein JWN61_2206 [Pseudonocardiales bacterium]|nr:hypothetical protein [Pseudonocardiales bacterium]
MTRARRALAATGLAAVLAAGLSGCGTDLAGFADRADAACAKSLRVVDRLATTGDTSTGTPTAALRTALDRYKVIELLVSELTEGALPGGADGSAIESKWLGPSRRSMEAREKDLLDLSHAVGDGDDDRVPELAASADRAGVDGVDKEFLVEANMPSCAALFS